MKSRVILAAGMLILASALGRAEETPPANKQQEPAAAAPAPPPAAPPPAPVAAPCCRTVPYDCCQKFQDWLTFCPQRTPCFGHCCSCSCTPSCPPLYTYFLDHCGYYGHGHGCGCAAPAASAPVPTAPVAAAPAPCETCGGGFWHWFLGR